VILVKMSAGLVIELALGPTGRFDALSVRLPEGLALAPVRFEVSLGESGRLLARPLDARPPTELVVALTVLAAHEENIVAEVRKYNPA
jgi:hypothetical protein